MKIAVVYWSGTGNTEAMARAVAQGAQEAGAEAELFTPTDFSADMVDNFDAIAFGCSAQGAETLEEYEFEPMFAACESRLKGKKIALFGSYDWGDGEWMREWQARCRQAEADLLGDGLIINNAPDAGGLDQCRDLGSALVG
ncbi:MAG: flavodoxin [Firmicutes bacterium]|nr:flavodoxin [Bacillota bacterium]